MTELQQKITPQIAAMYLGQKYNWIYSQSPSEFYTPDKIPLITPKVVDCIGAGIIEIKPHLRRLESITEQEAREVFLVSNDVRWEDARKRFPISYSCLESWWKTHNEYFFEIKEVVLGDPSAWLYLLSRGFDLFGLIESGLAKEIHP